MRRTVTLAVAAGLCLALLTLVPDRSLPGGGQSGPITAGPAPAAAIEDVGGREARLKAGLDGRPRPAPVSRNPFRFPSPPPPRPAVASLAAPALSTRHAEALPPPLSLAGIAERRANGGPVRTAVIAAPDGLHLVRAGERFSGRYEVVAVEQEAVQLRDLASQTAFTLRMR